MSERKIVDKYSGGHERDRKGIPDPLEYSSYMERAEAIAAEIAGLESQLTEIQKQLGDEYLDLLDELKDFTKIIRDTSPVNFKFKQMLLNQIRDVMDEIKQIEDSQGVTELKEKIVDLSHICVNLEMDEKDAIAMLQEFAQTEEGKEDN